MGQEIVYCNHCKSRLTGKDFEKGKAFRIENENLCLDCARKVLDSLPPAERDAFAARMKEAEARKTATQRIPVARPSETGSSTRLQRPGTGSSTRLRALRDVPLAEEPPGEGAAAESRSRRIALAAGGGLVLLAILVLILILALRPRRLPAPMVVEPSPPVATPPPAEEDPRLKELKNLWETALAYRKAHPDDFAGQIERFQKVKEAGAGTALAGSAEREIQEATSRRARKLEQDLSEIDGQIRPLLESGDLEGAGRLLESARTRHADPDWAAGIQRRLEDVARRRAEAAPVEPPPAAEIWTVLDPTEVKASGGATLKKLADRSLLAPRSGPDREVYVVTARSELKGITAFRLEALADSSLPARGPGRADNGNFILSEFRVEIDGRPAAFKGASSSWEQNGWPSSAAIDGDSRTGWAVMPRAGRDHEAVFHLREPADGGTCVFTLEFLSDEVRHVLGRFRISATAAALPDPPGPRRAERSSPPVPPAVRAYRDRWRTAAFHAIARDYAAALRALEEVRASLSDGDLKRESERDLADLKLAASLEAAVRKILWEWPEGKNLVGEIVLGEGRRVRLDEPVRRREGLLFEIRPAGEVRAVAAGELLGASLAEIFLASRGTPSEADRRAAGVLCALEGDWDAARRHLGGGIPAILEEHARRLAAEEAATGDEARRRLREAVNGFFDPATRAAAIETFAALRRDHKDAVVVRRCRDVLGIGPEALSEFAWAPADLKSSGHFSLQPLPKGEVAWVMGEDVPDRERRREHAVEAAYSAPANSEYRAWILAGGCCQEVFSFYLQADDLEVPGETTGIPVRCEPGGVVMAPVPPPAGLKKTHASHGGVKTPARFEWVALPVLKHLRGGTKRIRIVSDQQGFAVAGLLVSSTRKAPPREEEWRAIEARRPRARDLLDPLPASGVGWVLREVWKGIRGDKIENLLRDPKFGGPPSETHRATALEGPRNWANDYGTRIRGYLFPPRSGAYVFWICSDDEGELWLSSDDNPANKKKIAFLKGSVGFDKWEDRPEQRSTPVRLLQGRRYYFEVLHKEGGGDDHIRVGWKIPDGPEERPVPGNRLAPYFSGAPRFGVTLTAPSEGERKPGSNVVLVVEVSGASEVSRVEVFQGGRRLGEPKGSPPTYTWTRVPEGAYLLTARVVERNGRTGISAPLGIVVGEVYFARAVDLNGTGGRIHHRSWSGREAGGYAVVGSGHEQLGVDLKPPADPEQARMIRTSVFAPEGTKVILDRVPPGKYQVYLTVWEPRESPQGFEIRVNGKTVEAEVKFGAAGEWARLGPWPAEPVDGKIEVAAARGSGHFSGIELWSVGTPTVRPTQRVRSEMIGGGGGSPFEETRDGDPFLIGFRLGKENRLRWIQGIWEGDVVGQKHGGDGGTLVEVRANPGYAVGGLRLRGGDRVYAFRVVFMKIMGPVLNPSDSYESDWILGNEADTKMLGGDGYPVVGLCGGRGGDVDRLGIIQLK